MGRLSIQFWAVDTTISSQNLFQASVELCQEQVEPWPWINYHLNTSCNMTSLPRLRLLWRRSCESSCCSLASPGAWKILFSMFTLSTGLRVSPLQGLQEGGDRKPCKESFGIWSDSMHAITTCRTAFFLLLKASYWARNTTLVAPWGKIIFTGAMTTSTNFFSACCVNKGLFVTSCTEAEHRKNTLTLCNECWPHSHSHPAQHAPLATSSGHWPGFAQTSGWYRAELTFR